MKLIAPDTAATTCPPGNWLSAIFLAAFLTTIYASSAVAKTGAGVLSPAEEWVVARVRAGGIADLSERFPGEADRKLSARFLEGLLTGTLPNVKPHRNGVRIIEAIIDESIDLRNAQIPFEVWLEHCQFMASATFSRASFAGVVSFDDSAFKADATFNSMKVGHTASFNNAVFEGPADIATADIASDLVAIGAQFKNKEKGAIFNSMKVGHSAFFNDAVFEGPVDFVTADIASDLVADGAQFKNKGKEAILYGMKVGHSAFFKKAVFEGPVHFGSADIASEFGAQGAKFKNQQRGAIFNSMKVGGAAFFTDAVFEGPVDFGSADIASEFGAREAKFQNKEHGASFNGMKVRGHALFRKAVFEGPVDFGFADITGAFVAVEAKFKNQQRGASFNSMKVRGSASFNDAVFEGPVDLGYADFAWLDLSSPFWPKVAAKFRLRGMSYKYIRAVPENEPESHKGLLKLADQSAYTADVYSNLEEFFLRQGYRNDADRAFIAGKRRERKENLHGSGWLGSYLLDWLVGYGRRPWQAGIPCAVLVALGCVLFSPKKMEPQKSEDARRVYSRFWYSLNLFLPVVDLQAGKVWKPKADQTFLRNYMRVHILLGWILIPIVLAALTGLIK